MLNRTVFLWVLALTCLLPGAAQEPNQNDQIKTLSAAEMKRQTISCKPHEIKRGLLPKGTVVPIWVSVDEKGKIFGLTPAGKKCPIGCGLLADPIVSINRCKFEPLIVDGHGVPYKGEIDLVAP